MNNNNIIEWKKELSFIILFFIIIWGSGLYMYLEGERVPNLSILICGFIGYNKVSGILSENIANSKKNIINEWSFIINKKLYSWKKWVLDMKKFVVILAWNNIITTNWKNTLLNKNINNKNINFLENLDINLINSLISKKLYIIIMYEILQKKLYNKYNIWNIISKKNKLINIVLNNKLVNTIYLDIILIKLNITNNK